MRPPSRLPLDSPEETTSLWPNSPTVSNAIPPSDSPTEAGSLASTVTAEPSPTGATRRMRLSGVWQYNPVGQYGGPGLCAQRISCPRISNDTRGPRLEPSASDTLSEPALSLT